MRRQRRQLWTRHSRTTVLCDVHEIFREKLAKADARAEARAEHGRGARGEVQELGVDEVCDKARADSRLAAADGVMGAAKEPCGPRALTIRALDSALIYQGVLLAPGRGLPPRHGPGGASTTCRAGAKAVARS